MSLVVVLYSFYEGVFHKASSILIIYSVGSLCACFLLRTLTLTSLCNIIISFLSRYFDKVISYLLFGGVRDRKCKAPSFFIFL